LYLPSSIWCKYYRYSTFVSQTILIIALKLKKIIKMDSHETAHQVVVKPVDKEKVKKIWMVALILAVVTGIEFVFAFTMDAGTLRTAIFIGLTIVKAFYIVAEFMHLRHEVKVLVWSILLPMVFVVWLIIALLVEGNAIFGVRF